MPLTRIVAPEYTNLFVGKCNVTSSDAILPTFPKIAVSSTVKRTFGIMTVFGADLLFGTFSQTYLENERLIVVSPTPPYVGRGQGNTVDL
jgi:hypothetical protein